MNTELMLSITTIGISVVAICISISTSKKQNKVDLFEKKLDCYNDLRLYFDGKRIFVSAEVKLMGGNTKFNNGFKGNVEHLFGQIRLLFNKKIWSLTREIDELYKLILRADYMVNDYFWRLQETPNGMSILDKIKEYIEMQAQDELIPITTKEKEEFEKLCADNTIVFMDPVDGRTRLNYYDLNSIQNEAYQEITGKEKLLFDLMENDIKIKI